MVIVVTVGSNYSYLGIECWIYTQYLRENLQNNTQNTDKGDEQ